MFLHLLGACVRRLLRFGCIGDAMNLTSRLQGQRADRMNSVDANVLAIHAGRW